MGKMSDVRTEKGDLVPEMWKDAYQRLTNPPTIPYPRGYDQLSTEAGIQLITELASWQARAEQAESTIAAWKKDAEDKDVLIAELTKQVGQARDAALADAKAIDIGQPIGAVNPIYEDGYAAGWRNASHWWREKIEALRKQALSRSTDLEREDGK